MISLKGNSFINGGGVFFQRGELLFQVGGLHERRYLIYTTIKCFFPRTNLKVAIIR